MRPEERGLTYALKWEVALLPGEQTGAGPHSGGGGREGDEEG